MKALDPITAKMFPTLARYARKMKWICLLAAAAIIYVVGFQNGLLIGSYRGRVADEDYTEMRKRLVSLETFTASHHQKSLIATRAQVADSAWRRERRP